MTGKSYSNKANAEVGKEPDWAKVADNAAKKAEQELETIKRDAQELITKGKESFHHPKE